MKEVETGTLNGTGAAINISLGFKPSAVKVFNIADAGGLDPILEWVKGMGDGKGMKYLNIADDGSTSNVSHEFLATLGISEYAGADASASPGFTIGADTDLNVDGEALVWVAYR
jgi:hypothetical protein